MQMRMPVALSEQTVEVLRGLLGLCWTEDLLASPVDGHCGSFVIRHIPLCHIRIVVVSWLMRVTDRLSLLLRYHTTCA